MAAIPEEYVTFASDINHNGYAYDVHVHNVPIEQAQRAFVPLVSLPVYTKLANVYADSAAYEADGNTSAYAGSAMNKVKVGTYGYLISNRQLDKITETGESYLEPQQNTDGLNFTAVDLPLLERPEVTEPTASLGLAKDLLNLEGQEAVRPADKVLVLYRGWCPSSGYDIGVDNLIYTDGSLDVVYHLSDPDPDHMYLTVMTYVYSVAVITDDMDMNTELVLAEATPFGKDPDEVPGAVDFYSLEQAPLLAKPSVEHPVAYIGLAKDFLDVSAMNSNPDNKVLVLIRGWMSSTGYDINVQTVVVDGHTMTVSYETKDPGPDEFCGTVMTYVYEVVELKDSALEFGNYFIVTKPAEKPPVEPGVDEPHVLPMPLVARLTVGNSMMQMNNGNLTDEITLPVAPCVQNGATLVPIRAFMNAFSASVEYLAETNQIRISKGISEICLKIGSNVATVYGKEVVMPAKTQTIQGNAVAPLRTMAEVFGAEVSYDEVNNQVVVYLHNWEDKALR